MKMEGDKEKTTAEDLQTLVAYYSEKGHFDFAEKVLTNVSFYRFKAYLVPFLKNDGTQNYIPGTSFSTSFLNFDIILSSSG